MLRAGGRLASRATGRALSSGKGKAGGAKPASVGSGASASSSSSASLGPTAVVGGVLLAAGPAILALRLKRDEDFLRRTNESYPALVQAVAKVVDLGDLGGGAAAGVGAALQQEGSPQEDTELIRDELARMSSSKGWTKLTAAAREGAAAGAGAAEEAAPGDGDGAAADDAAGSADGADAADAADAASGDGAQADAAAAEETPAGTADDAASTADGATAEEEEIAAAPVETAATEEVAPEDETKVRTKRAGSAARNVAVGRGREDQERGCGERKPIYVMCGGHGGRGCEACVCGAVRGKVRRTGAKRAKQCLVHTFEDSTAYAGVRSIQCSLLSTRTLHMLQLRLPCPGPPPMSSTLFLQPNPELIELITNSPPTVSIRLSVHSLSLYLYLYLSLSLILSLSLS